LLLFQQTKNKFRQGFPLFNLHFLIDLNHYFLTSYTDSIFSFGISPVNIKKPSRYFADIINKEYSYLNTDHFCVGGNDTNFIVFYFNPSDTIEKVITFHKNTVIKSIYQANYTFENRTIIGDLPY
jgi:hypothetical protein